MRADRLISMLALLQVNGRMAAIDLAEELEVSLRTIYRDVDVLSAAGFPLYAARGPGGGIALLEDYRTSLTGLSEEEVGALFMAGTPAPLQQLAAGQKLKQARLKLLASLNQKQRDAEKTASQRIYLDAGGWGQKGDESHLQVIEEALWSQCRLRIVTRTRFDSRVEQVIDACGLVVKDGDWYLVAGRQGRRCVFRVDHLLQVELLQEHFERPSQFDLQAFWHDWCREKEDMINYQVTVRVSPSLFAHLPHYFPDKATAMMAAASEQDEQGWRSITLHFENIFAARQRLLAWGRDAEVLEPQQLRSSVIDFARQIVDFYAERKTIKDKEMDRIL